MPLDPFMFYHASTPFNINVDAWWMPLSVRDQMLRGCWAGERVTDCHMIGGNRRLAVIGAGVAGVCAAITAYHNGAHVTLLEKTKHAFGMHATARRVLDPTQYDWPLAHHSQGATPLPLTPEIPLGWSKDKTYKVVAEWDAKFQTFLTNADPARFEWKPLAEVVGLAPVGNEVRVVWKPPDSNGEYYRDFGLAISAAGIGKEKCFLEFDPKDGNAKAHEFQGYKFWASDPFDDPMLGVNNGAPPRVLISGGGDGALQDLLRVTTNQPSVSAIWDALGLTVAEKLSIQKKAHDIEDQAARAWMWSAHKAAHDYAVTRRLAKAYAKLACDVYRSTPSVAIGLDAVFRWECDRLVLVHPYPRFSQSFGFNRFLALLQIRHLKRRLKKAFEYWPKYRVAQIRCDHGAPALSAAPDPNHDPADDCHGQPHRVCFYPLRDYRDTNFYADPNAWTSPVPHKRFGEFDVIILRHGIKPLDQDWLRVAEQIVKRKPTRQLLPYHAAYAHWSASP